MEAAIPTWDGWVPWVPNIATTFTSLHVAPTSGLRYGLPTHASLLPREMLIQNASQNLQPRLD